MFEIVEREIACRAPDRIVAWQVPHDGKFRDRPPCSRARVCATPECPRRLLPELRSLGSEVEVVLSRMTAAALAAATAWIEQALADAIGRRRSGAPTSPAAKADGRLSMLVGRRLLIGAVALATIAKHRKRSARERGASAVASADSPELGHCSDRLRDHRLCSAAPGVGLVVDGALSDRASALMPVSSAIARSSTLSSPGRGEASKLAVLKVAAGKEYPGFSRAGGSLLCAHLLEMTAFPRAQGGRALFARPRWSSRDGALLVGQPRPRRPCLTHVVHRRFGNHLARPRLLLAGADAPSPILASGGDPLRHPGSPAGSWFSSCSRNARVVGAALFAA